MQESGKIVGQIAQSIVTAIRADKSAVIFLRVDGAGTSSDALDTLLDFNKHIRWKPIQMAGMDSPLRGFAVESRDDRTVYLVQSLDEHAMQVLNDNRDAYDRNKIRAVFLVETKNVRTLARLCPVFWNERDLFTAWPSVATEAETDAEQEQNYEQGVRKGIARRIESASKLPGGYDRGKALFVACRDAFYNMMYDEAGQHMVSAINDLRTQPVPDEMAEAFQILGAVAEHRQDPRSALDWYGESLRFWQESGSPEGLSNIYGSLGQLYYRIDEIDISGQHLQQALEIEETLNRPVHVCDICRMLGMVKERQEQTTDAQKLLERCQNIATELGDDVRVAKAMHHRARLQERLGRWTEAKDLYHQTLTIRERLRDTVGIATTLHQLGNVFFNQAEHEMSINCYERAIVIERELEDINGLASSLMQVAHVAEERFQHDVAYRALFEVRPLLKKLHSPLVPDSDKRINRITKMMTRSEMRRIEEEISEGLVIGLHKDVRGATSSFGDDVTKE